jgi:hypothetical protein
MKGLRREDGEKHEVSAFSSASHLYESGERLYNATRS